MPPKKQKPNAFMTFAAQWQVEHAPPNWSLQKCIPAAGKVWEKMSMVERQPYMNKAKNVPHSSLKSELAQDARRNCMGELLADVERETKSAVSAERMNIRTIDKIIRQVVAEGKLESQRFYFIMVNYFTKSLSGDVYVPAEIAFSEFSLEGGVSRVYHSHINPGVNAFGQRYQTEQYVNETHRLPLPPNALGEENMTKIYIDLLSFLDKSADNDGKLPPIYTTKEIVPIVENVLKFMKDPCQPDIRILPIEYLFFVLKDETCKACGLDRPKTQFITDAVFQRDKFEHQQDIGCQYHEDMDRSKYCAQSCVTRWGYQFAAYICLDLAILLEPGTHMPIKKSSAFIIVEPRDISLKEEASEEVNNNSVATGTSSMPQESNDNIHIKNEETKNSSEERNVRPTPPFIKTENSYNEIPCDEDAQMIPPPPPTNIDFAIYDRTNIKQDEHLNELPNTNNAHRISGKSISPVHIIGQPSPEQRKSNGGRFTARSPKLPRPSATSSRDGKRSASRQFEIDRRPSVLFDRKERQFNRDRRRPKIVRSRSPMRSRDTHGSRSPIRSRDTYRSRSPIRSRDANHSRSPMRIRDAHRNRSPIFDRYRSLSPILGIDDRRSKSPVPRFDRDRSNSPLHNFRFNREQSQSPRRRLNRERSLSPGPRFNRECSRSPLRTLNRDRSNSPLHNFNRDRSNSPLHNFNRERTQSPAPMLDRDPSRSPMHMFDRNINGSPMEEQQGWRTPTRFVTDDYPSHGRYQQDNQPTMMSNNECHSPRLRNPLGNYGERNGAQYVDHSSESQWQGNCPPVHNIPNGQHQQQQSLENANIWQQNQSLGRGPPHQQQNDFDNDNNIVRDFREYIQNYRVEPTQSPRIQVIIPPEIGPPVPHNTQQLPENDLRHRLKRSDRNTRGFHGNNQRDQRNSNCNPRNVGGNNQIGVGTGQFDARMLIGNNQREGRVMTRDPRLVDGNNQREGSVMQSDPRLLDGNNQGEGRVMQRDPRFMDGNNQIDGRNMQRDPRLLDGNNQIEGRNFQRDPRMPHCNNQIEGRNFQRDPRMPDCNNQIEGRNMQLDPRMLDCNNQIEGRNMQLDPRMLDCNNQIEGRNMQLDPRMLDGNNQREGIVMQRDPRIFDRNVERDPRNGQYDPRLSRNGQRDERNAQCDPRMNIENNLNVEVNAGFRNCDARLFVGNDQGQFDPRLFDRNNQISSRIGNHDPRMIVGNNQYNPRFANRDPRFANRDPRLGAGNNQSNRGPRQMLDDNKGQFVRSEFGLGTTNNYNFN